MDIVSRLMERVKLNESTGCLEWQGSKCRGYGTVNLKIAGRKRRSWRVHRVVWMLTKGDIPSGMCVCHACDNPSCCNMEHLFLGTHSENMADMAAKGRSRVPRGERNGSHKYPHLRAGERSGHAKLTSTQVLEIRHVAGTVTNRSLAKKYGVSSSLIGHVISGRAWKHLLKQGA